MKQRAIQLPNNAIFTGCTHLDHLREFIWQKRGFASVKEHADFIIREIASYAKDNPGSVLVHLGDGFLNSSADRAYSYFKAMRMPVYYINGNHEGPTYQIYQKGLDALGFKLGGYYPFNAPDLPEVTFLGEQAFFQIESQTIFAHHFPSLVWDKMHHGVWHIHSHNHGGLKESAREFLKAKRLDIGVDNTLSWFQKPYITFPQLKEIMDKKQFVSLDHHGENTT